MFLKKSSQVTHDQSSGRSFIGETLQIEGDIISKGALDVAGLIKGNIQGEEMIVHDTGFIKGNLKLKKIEINGHIEGEIEADIISLGSSAVVKGDLLFKSTLRTVEGADIDGYIKKTGTNNKISEEDKEVEQIRPRKEFGKPILIKSKKFEAV